ncbi:MAG TPA: LamG domain-containing protein [Fimbriimonadaceae bacterium]|nr:LamG domain-containing protein [Fimbriimonadaceae bacterium]
MNYRLAFFAAALASATYVGGQGHALRFTKDHQAVLIPDCPALEITGDITVEAWIRPEENVQGAEFKFIISKNYGGKGYALVMVGKGGEERIQFEASELLAYGAQQGYDEKAFRNTWLHVAGVVENGRQRLYINGLLVKENPKPAILKAGTMPLQIGGSPWNSFRGCIDEVRIWNVARTQEQINHDKNHYLTGREPGLVVYLTFDEGGGRTVHNLTGKTPDGVLGYGWKGKPQFPALTEAAKASNRDLPQWVSGVLLTGERPHTIGHRPERRP